MKQYSLGDCFRIKHGYAFKGEYFTDSGHYIVLTPGNFYEEGGFRLKPGKEKNYVGEIPNGYILNEGDLIVAMTEQAEGLLGSPALIPESHKYLHNQRLGLIHDLDERKLDKQFLYYLFNHQAVRGQIRATANGAKVRHTSPSRIYDVVVSVPEVPTQRRIAATLSAYDDLIENNSGRIAIVEEMGRALYQEWFVHFRFPGHEHVPLVESPLGPVPEGWETRRIHERFTTVLGGTPSRKRLEFWENGTVPWINSGKINELRVISPSHYITELGLRKSSAKMMPKGSTVIAITGATLDQVSVLAIPTSANQSVVGIWDKSGRFEEYLYRYMCDYINLLVQQASGGAQQHINKEVVDRAHFLVPPDHILERFDGLAQLVGALVELLLRSNENLRTTRDLLLPKLISGEIDVSAVGEEPVAEAAD